MARNQGKPGEQASVPAAVRPVHDEVIALIDAFCREHLNEEYEGLCRTLAGALARKRPSPLLGGKTTTWACGIVRTIGWVNFLDDRSQKPHMKLTAVDRAFGVAESTGQGKSKVIRGMLKVRPSDPRWTFPGRMDEDPIAWMISIDGFIVDARHLKREFQEQVFRAGLIPYIPADRPGKSDDE